MKQKQFVNERILRQQLIKMSQSAKNKMMRTVRIDRCDENNSFPKRSTIWVNDFHFARLFHRFILIFIARCFESVFELLCVARKKRTVIPFFSRSKTDEHKRWYKLMVHMSQTCGTKSFGKVNEAKREKKICCEQICFSPFFGWTHSDRRPNATTKAKKKNSTKRQNKKLFSQWTLVICF